MALRLLQLLSCFIRKFPISFHAFLRMTFHVIRPWTDSVCLRFPWSFGNFSTAPAEILDSNIFCNYPQYLCLFDILVECNPDQRGQRRMSALPNQRLSLVLSKSDWCAVSFHPILYRPRVQTIIVLDETRRDDALSVGQPDKRLSMDPQQNKDSLIQLSTCGTKEVPSH